MKITYKELFEIGNYKAVEKIHTINAIKYFKSGNLLYVYRDRFNVETIPINDVLKIEESEEK